MWWLPLRKLVLRLMDLGRIDMNKLRSTARAMGISPHELENRLHEMNIDNLSYCIATV